MLRHRPVLHLRLLRLVPTTVLAAAVVALAALAFFLFRSGLGPIGLLASSPAWICASMVYATRRRTEDRFEPEEHCTDAPAPVLALAVRAAELAGEHRPVVARTSLSGGVRARVRGGVVELTAGLGAAALLDDEAFVTLAAREVLAVSAEPALEATRWETFGRLERIHDRLASQYGALASPAVRLTAALHERATAVADRADIELDALAAGRLGADALARAIVLDACAAAVWESYWSDEVEQVLSAGFLPPLAAAFPGYVRVVDDLHEGSWDRLLANVRSVRVGRAETGARVRVLGVEVAPALPGGPDDRKLDAAEAALAAHAAERPLTRCSWPEATATMADRAWTADVIDARAWLAGIALEEVPATLRALPRDPDDQWFEDRRATALMALVALGLQRAGWSTGTQPGEPFQMRRGEAVTNPFSLGWALAVREAGDDDFADWCRACGLEDLPDADTIGDPLDTPGAAITPTAALPPLVTAGAEEHVPDAELLTTQRVRLVQSASGRLVSAAGLIIVGAIGLPVAAMSIYATVAAAPAYPIASVALGVLSAGLVALVVVVGRRTVHEIVARPTLTADAHGGLTIHHPALLRKPLRLSRDDLLVADVDTSGRDVRFAVSDPRRPRTSGQVVGWLWRLGEPPSVPVLDRTPDRPNVAIILRHAVETPSPRGSTPHATLRGERIEGLLLQAADPDRARELLGALGLLRPVTVDDLGAR